MMISTFEPSPLLENLPKSAILKNKPVQDEFICDSLENELHGFSIWTSNHTDYNIVVYDTKFIAVDGREVLNKLLVTCHAVFYCMENHPDHLFVDLEGVYRRERFRINLQKADLTLELVTYLEKTVDKMFKVIYCHRASKVIDQ